MRKTQLSQHVLSFTERGMERRMSMRFFFAHIKKSLGAGAVKAF